MNNDMTNKSEWKSILIFAIPIMGSNLLQMLYNVADSIIVGNFAGPVAFGAIGVTSSATWLLLNIVTGIGTGTSIAISQYFGAKKERDIITTVSTIFIFSAAVSLCITVLCFLFARPLLWDFLGTPEEMHADSYSYFVICASGIIFQTVYNIAYGILRAHGNSKGALIFLLISAIINVTLDLLFVIILQWGVKGAAYATIISQAAAASASVIYMWRLLPHLKFSKSDWVFDREKLKTVLNLAIPIIFQSSIIAIGFIIMQKLVNSFGPASIQGYFAMSKVEQILFVPSNAFNSAISSFTGHNIGAGNISRIKKGYKSTLYMGCSICFVLIIFIFIFGRTLVGMFNISDEALSRGVEHLNIIAAFMIINTTHNITVGLLQGAGDVKVPAVAGFLNLSVRLAASYFMATTAIDFRSIYFSIPFAWITAFAITVGRYRTGKWQTKAIV